MFVWGGNGVLRFGKKLEVMNATAEKGPSYMN